MSRNPTYPLTLIVLWGLVLEFPVRYFVSPDPWIHPADHWYFNQPARLLIEVGFVLLALLPFFLHRDLRGLLTVHWTKDNILYAGIGAAVTLLTFGLQQWDEMTAIHRGGLSAHIPVWLATGTAIGIGQELTFRGLIFTGILRTWGLRAAAVLSTLCFAFGSIHSVRMYAYLIHGHISVTLLLLAIFTASGCFFLWLRIKRATSSSRHWYMPSAMPSPGIPSSS